MANAAQIQKEASICETASISETASTHELASFFGKSHYLGSLITCFVRQPQYMSEPKSLS